MAFSGLFLCVFLVVHLAGNLLLFVGREEFNRYSQFMSTSLWIRFLEIGLFLGFLLHIIDGILLTIKNKRARTSSYKKFQSKAPLSSRIMHISAIFVLLFLVVHLYSFFIYHRFGEDKDYYARVVYLFSDPLYAFFYVIMMFFLSLHLWHGFESAFQTLGIRHKAIQIFGKVFATVVPLGFAIIPLYFLFR